MAAHKYIDRVCLAGALFSLLLSLLFMNGQALGIPAAAQAMGYEDRLFDTSRVHTIDIVMDDWDSFIETCENEEYASCAAVIDNEAYKNVGIRAKGNTSLSTVSQMGSDRYSFKLEFDHYDSGRTYYGLDKLCLNNVIQDNTYMKDYLTYRMMGAFGAAAPLCSYVYITVNGQDWGLYLAVEGVEDSFLQRNFGRDHGALYKPDSMSFGGGRGNGRDFDMGGFMDNAGERDGQRGGFGGGMGSADVKLQYIDDDPNSYANIFDSAKTDLTEGDQTRLIQSLKALGEGGDVSDVVDIDQVLRYFVVHNFVVNGDSYTGSMVHNYYLYEKDGRLSMLPWDYNLAFGTFQGGNASSAVNDPIDTPLSVTGSGDRPMADWIFASETYTAQYHRYVQEFLDTVDPTALIEEAYRLIAPYVEQDPTKFCTAEDFETGVVALKTFCALRAESVSGQLSGAIPSTSQGQSENGDSLVDASALTLSDMGTMNSGGLGFGRGGGMGRQDGDSQPAFGAAMPAQADAENSGASGRQFPGGGQPPEGTEAGNAGGVPDRSSEDSPPGSDGAAPSQSVGENGEAPGGQFPGGGQLPEGIEAGNFGGGFPGGPGSTGSTGDTPQVETTLILLAASALVLLAGLLAAFKFKR